MGIEPTYSAWKAAALPLSYTGLTCVHRSDWAGEDSNLRRLSQRIYSPPRLTASVPAREWCRTRVYLCQRTCHLPGSNRRPTVYKTAALPAELRWRSYPVDASIRRHPCLPTDKPLLTWRYASCGGERFVGGSVALSRSDQPAAPGWRRNGATPAHEAPGLRRTLGRYRLA